jgi:hypothetical protein
MGDVEPLSDGNAFIGWGGPRPIASEVTLSGTLLADLEVNAPGNVVYRWYLLPWTGSPTTPPALVALASGANVTLYYSWNGATQVSAYRVEAGPAPDQMQPVLTQPKQGFETSTVLTGAQTQVCYYRVVAVDTGGHDLRASDTISLPMPSCD